MPPRTSVQLYIYITTLYLHEMQYFVLQNIAPYFQVVLVRGDECEEVIFVI